LRPVTEGEYAACRLKPANNKKWRSGKDRFEHRTHLFYYPFLKKFAYALLVFVDRSCDSHHFGLLGAGPTGSSLNGNAPRGTALCRNEARQKPDIFQMDCPNKLIRTLPKYQPKGRRTVLSLSVQRQERRLRAVATEARRGPCSGRKCAAARANSTHYRPTDQDGTMGFSFGTGHTRVRSTNLCRIRMKCVLRLSVELKLLGSNGARAPVATTLRVTIRNGIRRTAARLSVRLRGQGQECPSEPKRSSTPIKPSGAMLK